jgi:trk system potassium uptake protein TrkA
MYEIENSEEILVEIKMHGEENMSSVIGKNLLNFKLPKGLQILAIMRNNEVLSVDETTTMIDKDRLIIKADNKNSMSMLEKLFQVMPLYIQ